MYKYFAACLAGSLLFGSASKAEETSEGTPEQATEATEVSPASVPCQSAAPRFWVDVEYLLWWEKNMPVAGPLVTTTSRGNGAGIPGQAGTSDLLGNSGLDSRNHSGGRFLVGGWIEPDVVGLEVGGFILETHTTHFWQDSDRLGNPLIARPFFNALTDQEDAQVITLPSNFGSSPGARGGVDGSIFGGIDVFSDSRLWGGEGNVVVGLLQGAFELELLSGFRYLGLEETLRFSQSSTIDMFDASYMPRPLGLNNAPVPASEIVSITDRSQTRNEFFGAQAGLRGRWLCDHWSIECTADIGLGDTKQWSNITGITQWTASAGTFASVPAGLYAVGDNRGLFSRDSLSYMSEEDLRVGYRVTRCLTLNVGCSFLYWNDVLRAGNQLQDAIDPRTIPSNIAYDPAVKGTAPVHRFVASDYWAMGLSVGVEFRY
jgi:hypothetical protein